MACGCDEKMTANEFAEKVLMLLDSSENQEADEDSGYAPNCKEGYEEKDGECVPIAVTCSVSLESVETRIEASTGKTVIEITGVAFHEGFNANNWKLTRQGAEHTVAQMMGADLTLNHPEATHGGFSRNMDGGVDEAIVGFITDAFVAYGEDPDKWDVRFKATVAREELFSALESGLWLREDYGVSIGGTGIPSETIEGEEGEFYFAFDTDFTFDHLAIVHNPAYERAKIETVERIEIESTDEFKYQPTPAQDNSEESSMSETEDNTIETASNDDEIESLKAEKILLEATIAEFKAAEEAIKEQTRMDLVDSASELGMKGHEDLSTDTLKGLISSWEEAHPEQDEVVMQPVEAKIEDLGNPETPEQDEAIVANWLNKSKMETPETVYAKAYNTWVSAWNGTLSGGEDRFRASTYEQLRGDN